MKLCALLVVLAVAALPTAAPAEVSRLSASERRRLERPAGLEMLASMGAVPADVVRACAAAMQGHEFAIADPGQPYQETDYIASPARYLPWRRLRWAARLPGRYVLHYEMGGYGHSVHVLLVRAGTRAGAARLIWSASPEHGLKDYESFVAALRGGKLDDNPAFIH